MKAGSLLMIYGLSGPLVVYVNIFYMIIEMTTIGGNAF